MNGLLKTELGFQGYVVSDWEGTHSGADSILSGLVSQYLSNCSERPPPNVLGNLVQGYELEFPYNFRNICQEQLIFSRAIDYLGTAWIS